MCFCSVENIKNTEKKSVNEVIFERTFARTGGSSLLKTREQRLACAPALESVGQMSGAVFSAC
jgi:hypothetical protein